MRHFMYPLTSDLTTSADLISQEERIIELD